MGVLNKKTVFQVGPKVAPPREALVMNEKQKEFYELYKKGGKNMKGKSWWEIAKENEAKIKAKLKEAELMAVKTEENDTFAVLLYDDGDLYISRYPFAYEFAGYAPNGDYKIVCTFDAWDYDVYKDDIELVFNSFIEKL